MFLSTLPRVLFPVRRHQRSVLAGQGVCDSLSRQTNVTSGIFNSVKTIFYSPFRESHLFFITSGISVLRYAFRKMQEVALAFGYSRLSNFTIRNDLCAGFANRSTFLLIYSKRRDYETTLTCVRLCKTNFSAGATTCGVLGVFATTDGRLIARNINSNDTIMFTSRDTIFVVSSLECASCSITIFLRNDVGFLRGFFCVRVNFQGVGRGQVISGMFPNGNDDSNRPTYIASRSLSSDSKFFLVSANIRNSLASNKNCMTNDASRSKDVINICGVIVGNLQLARSASITTSLFDVTKGLTSNVRKVITTSVGRPTSIRLLRFLGGLQVGQVLRKFQGLMATKTGMDTKNPNGDRGLLSQGYFLRVGSYSIWGSLGTISRAVGVIGLFYVFGYFECRAMGATISDYNQSTKLSYSGILF